MAGVRRTSHVTVCWLNVALTLTVESCQTVSSTSNALAGLHPVTLASHTYIYIYIYICGSRAALTEWLSEGLMLLP